MPRSTQWNALIIQLSSSAYCSFSLFHSYPFRPPCLATMELCLRALYGCVLTALGVTYSMLSFYILKSGLRQKEVRYRSRWEQMRDVLGTVTYPTATVLSLWYPRAGVTIYFLLAAFYLLPRRDL
jgi:hypothetical protein